MTTFAGGEAKQLTRRLSGQICADLLSNNYKKPQFISVKRQLSQVTDVKG